MSSKFYRLICSVLISIVNYIQFSIASINMASPIDIGTIISTFDTKNLQFIHGRIDHNVYHAIFECIEYIKKNHSIALMIDQRVSEGEKIYFFNYPALTTTLPAQLAIKYKLKIVPVFIEREKDNTFKVEFFNQIDPNIYENKSNLTKKLNEFIEAMLIKNPNEWIWSHDRWKL